MLTAFSTATAAAAQRVCGESGRGVYGEVTALVNLQRGRATTRTLYWSPVPMGENRPAAAVLLFYEVEDDAPRLEGVAVLNLVSLEPPPRARSATVALTSDTGLNIVRPWRLYAQLRGARATQQGTPAAALGVVPLGSLDDAHMQRLSAARSLRSSVTGEDGSLLSDANFDVARRAEAEAALAEALRRALDNARNHPERCAPANAR